MKYEYDGYYQGKLMEIQSNSMNFSDSMAHCNPDTYIFSGNSYSLKKKAEEMSA